MAADRDQPICILDGLGILPTRSDSVSDMTSSFSPLGLRAPSCPVLQEFIREGVALVAKLCSPPTTRQSVLAHTLGNKHRARCRLDRHHYLR